MMGDGHGVFLFVFLFFVGIFVCCDSMVFIGWPGGRCAFTFHGPIVSVYVCVRVCQCVNVCMAY